MGKAHTYLILPSVAIDGWERTAGGYQSSAISPTIDVLRLCLVQPSRVTEGEYNWLFDVLRHLSNHVLGERVWLSGCTNQGMRLHLLHYRKQIARICIRPLFVVSRKGYLGWRQLISKRFDQKTRFVETPKFRNSVNVGSKELHNPMHFHTISASRLLL